jgi:hypothetical protein
MTMTEGKTRNKHREGGEQADERATSVKDERTSNEKINKIVVEKLTRLIYTDAAAAIT